MRWDHEILPKGNVIISKHQSLLQAWPTYSMTEACVSKKRGSTKSHQFSSTMQRMPVHHTRQPNMQWFQKLKDSTCCFLLSIHMQLSLSIIQNMWGNYALIYTLMVDSLSLAGWISSTNKILFILVRELLDFIFLDSNLEKISYMKKWFRLESFSDSQSTWNSYLNIH